MVTQYNNKEWDLSKDKAKRHGGKVIQDLPHYYIMQNYLKIDHHFSKLVLLSPIVGYMGLIPMDLWFFRGLLGNPGKTGKYPLSTVILARGGIQFYK